MIPASQSELLLHVRRLLNQKPRSVWLSTTNLLSEKPFMSCRKVSLEMKLNNSLETIPNESPNSWMRFSRARMPAIGAKRF